MAYGLESFNSSGVVQFSTQSTTLVKLASFEISNVTTLVDPVGGGTVTNSGFTIYGWDGPNPNSGSSIESPWWSCSIDLPVGLDNSKVLVFARPAASNDGTYAVQQDGGRHSVMMFGSNPQSNLPRRIDFYSNLRGDTYPIEFLFAVKPGDATPETASYGLDVFDGSGTADSNLTFSSRFPLLQLEEAGSVNAYSFSFGVGTTFQRTYVENTGSISSGTSWSTDNAPFILISNTGFYGQVSGYYGLNPSGDRFGNDAFESNGANFANSISWTIGSGSWTSNTAFHLIDDGFGSGGSPAINYFGGTTPHDYISVSEGN